MNRFGANVTHTSCDKLSLITRYLVGKVALKVQQMTDSNSDFSADHDFLPKSLVSCGNLDNGNPTISEPSRCHGAVRGLGRIVAETVTEIEFFTVTTSFYIDSMWSHLFRYASYFV